jgi:hypothetical protein
MAAAVEKCSAVISRGTIAFRVGVVDGQAGAAQRHQQFDPDEQLAAVGGVDDRAAVQRADQQRDELGQRNQADVQRRVCQPVDLVRDGDRGELGAKQRHQLPAEQHPQITGLPQRREVDEDPSSRYP